MSSVASSPAGYVIDGLACDSTTAGSVACAGATCAAGYQGTVSYSCQQDGAALTLSGCQLSATCQLPAQAPTGYSYTGQACASLNTLSLDCSGVVQCASGYAGTAAVAACSTNGGNVVFSGCNPDECALGTHNCDANAACQDTAAGFTCTCNDGFTGDGTTCDQAVNRCYNGQCGCPPYSR